MNSQDRGKGGAQSSGKGALCARVPVCHMSMRRTCIHAKGMCCALVTDRAWPKCLRTEECVCWGLCTSVSALHVVVCAPVC